MRIQAEMLLYCHNVHAVGGGWANYNAYLGRSVVVQQHDPEVGRGGRLARWDLRRCGLGKDVRRLMSSLREPSQDQVQIVFSLVRGRICLQVSVRPP